MVHGGDEETLELDAIDLLESGGYEASPANVERLVPVLIQARPVPQLLLDPFPAQINRENILTGEILWVSGIPPA